MAVIKELIRKENNGSISFGNYELPQKTKLADFEVNGDLYKVKTFKEITKLEKNGTFVYESIPGTAVSVFKETADEVSFFVDGKGQTQITLELESNKEYRVFVGDRDWRKDYIRCRFRKRKSYYCKSCNSIISKILN